METQGAKAVSSGTGNENAFFKNMEAFCLENKINIVSDLKLLKTKAPCLSEKTSISMSVDAIKKETSFDDGIYLLAIPTEKKHKEVSWAIKVEDKKTNKSFSVSVKFDACFFIVKDKKIVSLTFIELKNCEVEGSDTEKLGYKANFIIDENIPAKFMLIVSGKLSEVGQSKYVEVKRLGNIERLSRFQFIVAHEFQDNPKIIYDYVIS